MASPKVIAAGHAAASWARARRATWTDAPLSRTGGSPVPEPSVEAAAVLEPPIVREPEPAAPAPVRLTTIAQPPASPIAPEPPPVTAPKPRAPRDPERAAALRRWIGRGVAAAALGALSVGAVLYLGPMVRQRAAAIVNRPEVPQQAPPPKTTGGLRVTSTPTGARVLVDGTVRGVTPLTIDEVHPGRHAITLESSQGTVQRSVTVTAGAVAAVDESIYSGWVAIFSPFEIAITEGTRALRPDDRNEIMLSAGRHDLRFVNRTLGYDERRQVDVKPGEKTAVSIVPPRSTLTISSAEAAEVWLDGTRIGDTPLTDVPVDLGTHDLRIKRAAGERHATITVTTRPFVFNADGR